MMSVEQTLFGTRGPTDAAVRDLVAFAPSSQV